MSLERGLKGEEAACKLLRRSGYKIIERNYRGPRYEVDIIAREGDVIAFVEVKTRPPGGASEGAEAIGPRKQHRIARAAEHYLMTHPGAQEAFCRFDVVLIEAEAGKEAGGGRLIRDAYR